MNYLEVESRSIALAASTKLLNRAALSAALDKRGHGSVKVAFRPADD
jgi:hypothetical protein